MAVSLSPAADGAALAANDLRYSAGRSRSAPIAGTMRSVPGYPESLRVFLIAGSPYWQARCFFRGRMRTRSLATTELRRALQSARAFYEELAAALAGTPAAPAGTGGGGPRFRAAAERMLAAERSRAQRGEFGDGSLRMLESQLRREVLPVFGELPLAQIQYPRIDAFVQALSARGLSPTTVHHYLIALRKVLRHAVASGALEALPEMPSVRLKAAPRGGFALDEYRRLVRAARAAGEQPLARLARFMVNSFVRPHDIKLLRHEHVEVVRGASTYLRLRLPETKRKTAPVVTLAAAVGVYERLRAGAGGAPSGYVFHPEIENRDTAMWKIDQGFRRLLERAGLRTGPLGRARTLYSLRHTAIMFRLLYGRGIDLLTLARNARTSVAMIERFYASNLTAEMNISLLQSRRARRE